MASAIQDGVGVEALMNYHVLRASGHAARLERDDDDVMQAICMCHNAKGDREARFDGNFPDDKARTDSVNWLTDRGFGSVVQVTQLEALVKHEHSTRLSLPAELVDPAKLFTLLGAFTGATLAPPAPPAPPPPRPGLPTSTGEASASSVDTADAIDAEYTELEPPPASASDDELED